MSLRLLAQLHGAFGERGFTFVDYWADQRGHRAPVRDDVDAFIDLMNSYVRRGFLQRAPQLRNGEGWRITDLGIKAVKSRHANAAARIEREQQRFIAAQRQREQHQVLVAIELLTRLGYQVTDPKRVAA